MYKKLIPITLAFCLFLIPFNVSAVSCFTSEEILLINNIAIKNNESSSLLLGIFDKICERVTEDVFETELNQLRYDIINMTDEQLNNYTNYITNKTQIIDALSAIANIKNKKGNIDEYFDELDIYIETKMEIFNGRVLEIIRDTEEEFEGGYIKKSEFDDMKRNMTMETQRKLNEITEIDMIEMKDRIYDLEVAVSSQPDYMPLLIFLIAIIVIPIIAWKIGYIKPKKEVYPSKKQHFTHGTYNHTDHVFDPETKKIRKGLDEDKDLQNDKKKYQEKIIKETKKIRKGIKTLREDND